MNRGVGRNGRGESDDTGSIQQLVHVEGETPGRFLDAIVEADGEIVRGRFDLNTQPSGVTDNIAVGKGSPRVDVNCVHPCSLPPSRIFSLMNGKAK